LAYLGNQPTSATFAIDSFNGDNSTVNFTLREAPVTTAAILVFVNGVRQHTDTYSVSGRTLTFSEAPPTDTNNIQVLFLGLGASPHIPSDYSVSTIKIQTNAITSDKIGLNQITSNLIAAGTITGDKIGLTAITGNLIATGTITGDKIAANTLTGNLFLDGTITGQDIAANTIGSSNLTITGVTAGSYGGVGNTVSITVDAQGRITRSSNVTNQWLATGSDVYTLSSVLVGSTSAIAGYTQVSVTGSSTNRGAFVMGRTTAATTGVAGTLLAYNGSNAICGMDFQSNSANNSGYIGTYTYSAGSFVQGPYLNTAGTSWTTASDQNLKDVTCEITNALNKISQIRAVEFTWKADKTKKQHVGFIAQDVQAVLPEVIDTDTNGHLGVRYAEVTSLLLAAIKEQQTLIESLTTRLTALEQT